MLFQESDLRKHIESLGLQKNDIVMIHGDAGIALQYIYEASEDPVLSFINHIISYFSDGTVIVPAFTYSATKGEAFCPETTPSDVGVFSEKFRSIEGVVRSEHPIFSICAIGKDAEFFTDSLLFDCFGDDTFFDRLYKKNVYIITLGCAFERVTFVHYVEQKLGVSYRYFKNFDAIVRAQDISQEFQVRYFVRNLDIDTTLDMNILETTALHEQKLNKKSFGRFLARIISARDFFEAASKLIEEDEYALIKESKA